MTPSEIIQKLKNKFPENILDANPDGVEAFIKIAPTDVLEVITFLKEDPEIKMDLLNLVTGVDWNEDNRMEIVYHLSSMVFQSHKLAVHAFMDRKNPKVASLCSLYGTANWHERETYDLLGIVFEGHPDLRRLLLPDDWEGHPLRKDYKYPEEYHGIKWA
jgi:NADH-quinone oxidoreductase subunit C